MNVLQGDVFLLLEFEILLQPRKQLRADLFVALGQVVGAQQEQRRRDLAPRFGSEELEHAAHHRHEALRRACEQEQDELLGIHQIRREVGELEDVVDGRGVDPDPRRHLRKRHLVDVFQFLGLLVQLNELLHGGGRSGDVQLDHGEEVLEVPQRELFQVLRLRSYGFFSECLEQRRQSVGDFDLLHTVYWFLVKKGF